MGKKSDHKSPGKAPKLPKRIAGIKLPKELRKSGNMLLATANSPIGREMLASGLMAAIGSAVAQRTTATPPGTGPAPKPAPTPASTPQETPIDPAEAGARAARQIVDLIGGAATAALTRYREENRQA